MKTLILTLGIVFALLAGSTTFMSCSSGNNKKAESTEQHMMDEQEHEMADHDHEAMEAVYTCPMHPEVKGKKGDKCPKCGMELVLADTKNEEQK